MGDEKSKLTSNDVLRWFDLEGKVKPEDFAGALQQVQRAGDAFKAMGEALAQLADKFNQLLGDINDALGPEAMAALEAENETLPWFKCCFCQTTHLGPYCGTCKHLAGSSADCKCKEVPPPHDLADGALPVPLIDWVGFQWKMCCSCTMLQNIELNGGAQCHHCGHHFCRACDIKTSAHREKLIKEGGADAISKQ